MSKLWAWRFLSVVMASVVIAWLGAVIIPTSYVQANIDRGAIHRTIIVPYAPAAPHATMVAAGATYTVGLKADGSVIAVGSNHFGECDVSSWTDITQVAAGYYHTVGLKADGSVVAVGWNDDSQCNVSSWTGITQVAAGYYHTVGIKADGSVVAVGNNDDGQCDVSSWAGITQVAAGGSHTVGIKADGSVVAVGYNDNGQCDVSSWTGITQVAAGRLHTVGLKADGSVIAVGDNMCGDCDVSSWTGITQVAAGYLHTVGLKSDGSVVAVGWNEAGQCNVGSWTGITQVAAGCYKHTVGLKSDDSVVAVGYNLQGQCNISSWTGITQVAAAGSHTVGIKADGSVIAVGYNDEGQCNISSWTGITQMAAAYSRTVGLKADGSVVAVGYNDNGQCDVGSWTGITQVAAGYHHTVALKTDGSVVVVGNNYFGQCDVGSWTDITQVAAGEAHTVGLKSDGSVVAVGRNVEGQCNISSWTGITQVAAGTVHTVGLKSDGSVVAVGKNYYGQCDVGSWTSITQVAAGGSRTVGIKADGSVVSVGNNGDGQCDVSSWAGITQVAAGTLHTVGLKSDGSVVAVGMNDDGQCNTFDWNLGATGPPSVSTNPATSITINSATLNGNLTSLGTYDNATVSFQWGLSSEVYNDNTTPQLKSTEGTFSDKLTSLHAETTYYYRAKATSDGNTIYGSELNFTTGTQQGISVTPLTLGFGSILVGQTGSQQAVTISNTGTANLAVGTITLTGTNANQFAIASDNASSQTIAAGASRIVNVTFNPTSTGAKSATLSIPSDDPVNNPVTVALSGTGTSAALVTTGSANNISANSAKLHGSLNALGASSSYNVSFQYGVISDNYSVETPAIELTEADDFEYKIKDLAHGTKYYYRAKAVGNDTAYGEEKSFTTSGQPFSITTSTNSGTLTLESNGGNFTAAIAIPIGSLPNQPGGYNFIHGLCGFTISDIEPGATVTITMTFPQQLPSNIQYLKYQPSHGWFQIPIISLNNKTITIQITDGGLGDADGLANGIIEDPGGVAIPVTPTPTPANPLIGTGAPTSHGSSVAATPPQAPVALSNIYIQSASLSASKVTPGTPITVTANIANRGTVNGTMRIKLYINGEEDSSQGVTVESGGNRSVYFTVSRSQPGTYSVYIGGTQAGIFTIDDAIDPNIVLFISCTLIAFSLILGIVYILRRRDYRY